MIPRRRAALALLAVWLLAPGCALLPESDREPVVETATATDSQSSESSGSSGGNGTPLRVRGSGKVRVEERAVSGFDRVRLGGIGHLFIEQAGEESLTVEAEDNLLPLLTSEVVDGRLSLVIRPNTTITATRPIVYRLKVRSFGELDASGTGRVEAAGIDVPDLAVEISGSVRAAFAGRAEHQVLEVSGTGEFDGRELAGSRASVQASGTSRVTVNVADELDAEVGGASTVEYLGNPRVERQLSGLGRVEAVQ